MTTSVCMGIYNGADYLKTQLESILNQTKQPDEVILCEDGGNCTGTGREKDIRGTSTMP